MIAKIRLITNADAVETAYEELANWMQLRPEDRKGYRRPKIPKCKYDYTPLAMDISGIKFAYIEGDVIQLRDPFNGDLVPIKNEPHVWEEISGRLDNKSIGGFGQKK